MKARLHVVIVNWNAGPLLHECVASVATAAQALPVGASLSVTVVDNASSDDSAQGLALPGIALRVLTNTVNRGFAAACNQGARDVEAQWLLFLNPDTRLFVSSLAEPLQQLCQPEHVDTGIAGIQLVDEQGRIARSCARFPRTWHFVSQAVGLDRIWPSSAHAMREWDHLSTRRVDQVIGAFFLVRASLFEALGGFDERFFVYFEEVDFSLRANRAGWKSVYLAQPQAFHRGGGTTDQVRAHRLFYSLRSRLRYGAKHFDPINRLALVAVTWLVEPVVRVLHLSLQFRWKEAADVVRAYRMLAADALGDKTN